MKRNHQKTFIFRSPLSHDYLSLASAVKSPLLLADTTWRHINIYHGQQYCYGETASSMIVILSQWPWGFPRKVLVEKYIFFQGFNPYINLAFVHLNIFLNICLYICLSVTLHGHIRSWPSEDRLDLERKIIFLLAFTIPLGKFMMENKYISH